MCCESTLLDRYCHTSTSTVLSATAVTCISLKTGQGHTALYNIKGELECQFAFEQDDKKVTQVRTNPRPTSVTTIRTHNRSIQHKQLSPTTEHAEDKWERASYHNIIKK